jgi:hypothetical protein
MEGLLFSIFLASSRDYILHSCRSAFACFLSFPPPTTDPLPLVPLLFNSSMCSAASARPALPRPNPAGFHRVFVWHSNRSVPIGDLVSVGQSNFVDKVHPSIKLGVVRTPNTCVYV